ncbi:MAG: glycosyltransferase family 2 protein [Clostridiaceae bacterium]|nr:glycosyltransferase family 2 protein [Clostridiaceae bacterium]
MSEKRILVASPIREKPEVLREYADSLLNLDMKGIKADFLFIDDNVDKESVRILQRLTQRLPAVLMDGGMKPVAAISYSKHQWDVDTIFRVSEYRNRILRLAREGDYDGLFFVDSDLILHPQTLRHLVRQDKDIISEIYWTRWDPSGPSYPQIWLCDNYTQYEPEYVGFLDSKQIREKTETFHSMLKKPGVYKVGGLGGCTLINKNVLKSNVSFTRIYNLSFKGEDRHFCVRAAANGFEMYVDTTFPAYHIYRGSDLPGCKKFKEKCSYKKNEGI